MVEYSNELDIDKDLNKKNQKLRDKISIIKNKIIAHKNHYINEFEQLKVLRINSQNRINEVNKMIYQEKDNVVNTAKNFENEQNNLDNLWQAWNVIIDKLKLKIRNYYKREDERLHVVNIVKHYRGKVKI